MALQIPFEELEQWYKNQLDIKYGKLRKGIRKMLEKIVLEVAEMRESLKRIEDKDVEITDARVKKKLEQFLAKYAEEFDKIHLPDEVTHKEIKKLIDQVQKLFVAMNEIGKKNIPQLVTYYKDEIKSIEFGSRKLGQETQGLDAFLRKKYTIVQEAEALFDKMQTFAQVIDKIERTRTKMGELEVQKQEMEEESTRLERALVDLEHNETMQEYSRLRNEIFHKRADLDLQLKFKKGLQKMRVMMSKNQLKIPGLSENQIKECIKDPIENILHQGEEIPQLVSILGVLRGCLDRGEIELKADTKNRIVENINNIVDDRILADDIREINSLTKQAEGLQAEVDSQGMLTQVQTYKDDIARLTIEMQHLIGEIERTKDEHNQAVQKLQDLRETVQTSIKKHVDQDVKIQISINA
ncbi:MAG TPA: hypothetical protein VKK79_13435 [Candidatus Lokiarchaeia archaeon]|nr:hypothetical protein [Candidatus Lokiarchaeia archaeon]